MPSRRKNISPDSSTGGDDSRPLFRAVRAAVGELLRAGLERPAALRGGLDLLAVRRAAARGLLPDPARSDGQLPPTAWREGLRQLPDGSRLSRPNVAPEIWLNAAAALGEIALAELAAGSIGEVYESLLEFFPAAAAGEGRRQRRRQGAFYTPPELVGRILDLCAAELAEPAAVLCDPAMGAGNFLLAAIERVGAGDLARAREFAARRLCGVDLDAGALRAAELEIYLRLSRPGDPFFLPAGNFVAADTLLTGAAAPPKCANPLAGLFPQLSVGGGFGAIIGNPPYEVLTNFAAYPAGRELSTALRASGRYPLSCCGQLNLYRCFIELALRCLRPGGALSFVVPATLLTDRAAAPLRCELLTRHGFDRAELLPESAGAFRGVTQAVTVFRARRGGGRTRRVTVVTPEAQTAHAYAEVAALSPDLIVPPAGPAEWRLAAWLREHAPRRFDELAEGAVGEVDQTVYRRFMRAEPTLTLLARGCHLTAFRLDLTPAPGPGRFLDRAGFLAAKGAGERWPRTVARPRVVQLGIRNLESRPRLVAARAPGGIFLGNSLNFWLPRSGQASLDLLLGLLNSRLYDWRFRLTSGNNNINLAEVRELPYPAAPDPRTVAAVEHAARQAETAVDLAPARRRLDEAVERLFGLPAEFAALLGA